MPSTRCGLWRKLLGGLRWTSLRFDVDASLLLVRFDARGGESPASRAVLMALALTGRSPRLVLLDARGEVLDQVEESGRPIDEEFLATLRELARQRSPEETACTGETAASPELSFELESALLEEERVADVAEARRAPLVRIRRQLKRKRRGLDKVRAELETFRSSGEDQRAGELLKASFHELRRGQTEVEVVDWFDPAMPKRSIRLDAQLTPQENIERYFRRHHKAKRALPILEARLGDLEKSVAALERLQEEFEAAADLASIDALLPALDGIDGGSRKRTRAKGQPDRKLGPRRFVSHDGYEVLVGRGSKQNDELSLRMARGNDIFLHVSGRPGAHVIVRNRPGKSVPTEVLLDAAALALYYSLPRRSSRALLEGATADVDYTPAKYVTKPKGARPGLVLLSRHKTLHIALEKERLERLLTGAPGVDRPGGA